MSREKKITLSRFGLAECYLRTYTHLLVQHNRFLWLSRNGVGVEKPGTTRPEGVGAEPGY